MGAAFVGSLFFGVWLVLAVPTLILLLKCYGRTKMRGFLWLLVALVVWPFVARLISLGLPIMVGSMGMGIGSGVFGVPGLNFFVLLSLAETLVGGVLLLTALYVLDRELAARTPNASPPPPPPATF